LAELHQKNAEKPLTVNSGEENGVSESVPSLRHDTLHLSPPEPPALKKTAANYVPAGSFVKAVLLSGLDVSAGVTASQEPRPVLLRLMDKGSLPNHLHSHLEDCRLIGAAVGDISSERAYIRLERLSCMHGDAFSDFPVFGYVAGNDGKAGIRGRVVMKDAAIVSRAFFSGFFGGLSEGGANSVTDSSVSALGQVNSVSAGNVLKYSGYEGVSQAMDLYADYLIKRAELYQPVIEVSAGTPVDVVFHKGFYLEGLSEKDAAPMKASKTIPTFYTQQSEINEEE
jgi:conjugal transfer pilus assembly protein TraB